MIKRYHHRLYNNYTYQQYCFWFMLSTTLVFANLFSFAERVSIVWRGFQTENECVCLCVVDLIELFVVSLAMWLMIVLLKAYLFQSKIDKMEWRNWAKEMKKMIHFLLMTNINLENIFFALLLNKNEIVEQSSVKELRSLSFHLYLFDRIVIKAFLEKCTFVVLSKIFERL